MSRTNRALLPLIGLSFLVAWPVLARAEKKHPAEEKGSKSVSGDVETTIKFVNKSGKTVKVYWLDYEGDRKLYQTLEDGESYDQQTYLTHPWVITDENDEAWYVYFPDAQPRSVEIVAPNSAAQGPPPQPDRPDAKLPALVTATPLKEDPKDDDLRKLLKARYNEAVGEMKGRYKDFLAGIGPFDSFVGAGRRLTQAGLELYDKPADKVALLTQFVELTKTEENIVQTRYDAGRIPIAEFHQARYQRLDAEIQLLRAKRAADKADGN